MLRAPRAIGVLVLSAAVAAPACGSPASPGGNDASQTFAFTFGQSLQDWSGLVAPRSGVPVPGAGQFVIQALPLPLDTSRSGFYLSGDGALIARRRVAGLRPNSAYDAAFTIEVASNTPTVCFTAFGDQPAANLYAGVVNHEPQPLVSLNGSFSGELTFGSAAKLGQVSSGLSCTSPRVWTLRTLTGAATATTDDLGLAWLLVASWGEAPELGVLARPFYITSYNVRLTIR
jgi:hypothetical protein